MSPYHIAEIGIFLLFLQWLRKRANLSYEELGARLGIDPIRVAQMEYGDLLPNEEERKKLEKFHVWPVHVPPFTQAIVKFGDWEKPFVSWMAPFARELLIASFRTRGQGLMGLPWVELSFSNLAQMKRFLDIVAYPEAGTRTVYSRINPKSEREGPIPPWSFELTIEDTLGGDGGEPDEYPAFVGTVKIRIPPHEIPILEERLRQYNQKRDRRFQANATAAGEPTQQRIEVFLPGEDGEPGESLAASRISPTTAEILSFPTKTNLVSLHDLVRVSESGTIQEVLDGVTYTKRTSYEASSDPEEGKRQGNAIKAFLGQYAIESDSVSPGLVVMAVPISWKEDRLREICAQCPVLLTAFRYPTIEEMNEKAKRAWEGGYANPFIQM